MVKYSYCKDIAGKDQRKALCYNTKKISFYYIVILIGVFIAKKVDLSPHKFLINAIKMTFSESTYNVLDQNVMNVINIEIY